MGSKTDTYDDTDGYLVEGPTNPATGEYQWIADPFTPKKASTVTEIEIALVYLGSGTNNAEVALTDVKGLPGKALETWNVKNLPTSGTCCKLVTVKSKKGIKVKKGKQYWVVGMTDKASDHGLRRMGFCLERRGWPDCIYRYRDQWCLDILHLRSYPGVRRTGNNALVASPIDLRIEVYL